MIEIIRHVIRICPMCISIWLIVTIAIIAIDLFLIRFFFLDQLLPDLIGLNGVRHVAYRTRPCLSMFVQSLKF